MNQHLLKIKEKLQKITSSEKDTRTGETLELLYQALKVLVDFENQCLVDEIILLSKEKCDAFWEKFEQPE